MLFLGFGCCTLHGNQTQRHLRRKKLKRHAFILSTILLLFGKIFFLKINTNSCNTCFKSSQMKFFLTFTLHILFVIQVEEKLEAGQGKTPIRRLFSRFCTPIFLEVI
jgi:hypothetical protein